jgi:hypothetical protein
MITFPQYIANPMDTTADLAQKVQSTELMTRRLTRR